MNRLLLALFIVLYSASIATAQIIPSLPYTLFNGTVADATQVMADFNQIVNSVNSNAAPVNSTITPSAFRNALIDGDMSVAQRGTSFTGISSGASTQTLDGWFGWTSATGNMTISQQTLAVAGAGINNVLRVQRPNGDTHIAQHSVGQIIKTSDVEHFAGQAATLSFYARSGANFSAASGNIAIIVGQGTGADEGSNSYVLATWTGNSLALATTQAITSTLTRYSVPVSFLSNTTEIAVNFYFTSVGTAGAADYFDITGVQLEQASTDTTYESLPFFTQLNRCLPYYRKSFPYATAPAQSAGVTGAVTLVSPAAASFGASFDFPSTMFKTPSVTTYNPSASNANWRDVTNGADRTVTVNEVNADRVTITGASGSASALNRIHYTAEAGI
jgi:hypothetical protein